MKSKLFIVIFIVGILSTVVYAKKIRYTVEAYYDFEVRSPKIEVFRVSVFEATGGCGKSKKKKCIERALSKIHKCMKAHSSTVTKNVAPIECSHKAGVKRYDIVNLRDKIKSKVCRKYKSKKIIGSFHGSTRAVGSFPTRIYKKSVTKKLLIKELSFNCK